jgi:hypothetical protein
VKPAFRERGDPNHVSLVATISFSGETLTPMILTAAEPNFQDPKMAELASDMRVCKTEKGYQTHESMAVYLRDILTPYCLRIRTDMNDPTLPIFLIMDNCGSHKKDVLSPMYAALNVSVIWLPPHSTHFLQPLDLVMFARAKIKYRDQSAIKTKPKWQSKILRIHRAGYECAYRPTVKASWSAAGIIHRTGGDSQWGIDEISIARKVDEYCKPQAPGAPNEGPGIHLPTQDDILHWLAGARPAGQKS